LLNATVAEISYPAKRGHVSLPVGYVRDGDTVLVVVGRPEGKRWWRHFRRAAQPVTIRVREGLRQGLGRAVRSGERGWERAAALWRQRHPGRAMPSDVAVLIELIAR
jgi:hypothetical protein